MKTGDKGRDERKFMDIQEFVEGGYLQEVNRLFFHPLGLALSVTKDDDVPWSIGGIWDVRYDPEGVIFDPEYIVSNEAAAKAATVRDQLEQRVLNREKGLGYVVQPVGIEAVIAEEELGEESSEKQKEDF
jgi:hypothetical protein